MKQLAIILGVMIFYSCASTEERKEEAEFVEDYVDMENETDIEPFDLVESQDDDELVEQNYEAEEYVSMINPVDESSEYQAYDEITENAVEIEEEIDTPMAGSEFIEAPEEEFITDSSDEIIEDTNSYGDKHIYFVMPGDTLGEISRKIYGSTAHYRRLASENSIVDVNLIEVGQIIQFSADDAASKSFAQKLENQTKLTHKVKEGETLGLIAKKKLGTIHAWKLFWVWNKDEISNPDQIRVGQILSYYSHAALAH